MNTTDSANSVNTYDALAKEAFWQEHIKLKQESGISRAAYCRKHELNCNHFAYWEQKSRASAQLTEELLPVKLVSSKHSDNSCSTILCTLSFQNGNELKVHDQAIIPLLVSLLS
jgi:hypothetical protein